MAATIELTASSPAAAQYICPGSGGSAAGSPANLACGFNFANGINSGNTAIGGALASASGDGSANVANGAAAQANGNSSANIAIGGGSVFAQHTNAAGNGSNNIAVGFNANASGDGTNNVAIGANTIATGANASAFGNGAQAAFANSSAFGNGAVATRADQQIFGTASNTYTMAGINSTASQGAQSGPLSFVTSDSNGNLAGRTAAELGLASTGDITGINSQLGDINNRLGALTAEARRGIAAVAALAPVITPSAPGRTTFSLNTGFYRGQAGLGFGLAHRLHWSAPLIIHGSYSNGGGREHLGRIGFAAEF